MSRKLAAGQAGTKKMVERYGDRLICVRYRYDSEKRIKYKTVELIVEKGVWNYESRKAEQKRKVGIRVKYSEIDIRRRIKAAGGTWNAEKKHWELDYGIVKKLGLTDRIVTNKNN